MLPFGPAQDIAEKVERGLSSPPAADADLTPGSLRPFDVPTGRADALRSSPPSRNLLVSVYNT